MENIINNKYIIENYIWFLDLLKKQEDIWRFYIICYSLANYMREEDVFYYGNPYDIDENISNLLRETFHNFFEIIYGYYVKWWETWVFIELNYKKEDLIYFCDYLEDFLKKYLNKEKIDSSKIIEIRDKLDKLYRETPRI